MTLKSMQCDGKASFATPQLAQAVVSRRGKNRGRAYRCKFCGFFHIGSDTWEPPSKKTIRSMNRRNATKNDNRRTDT